jgi:exopolysaccharide biosynthesis polyprenyl glycosylphosphotransferase
MLIGAVGRKMTEQIGCEKLGDIEDFEQILYKYRPDYVVFAFDSYGKEGTIKLVNLCNDNCVKTYFLPAIYGFFKSSRQVEHLGSLPLINAHSTPLDNPMNAFIKRTIDIFGSLALIIITSPIMIAAAIGVKISSPGPIFFRQLRVGRMGKQFYMLKFRSMRVNDKSGTAWSTGVDDRKTKFGNFIRRTSIDELPQFFNVLAGNMSLVGPRPEIPHFVEYFKDKIPLYMIKHYVKPGITGLAQIKGLRGDTSIEDRIHEDINYIESWSLGLDIYILLKTPFKAVNKSEVYVNTEEKGDEEEDD